MASSRLQELFDRPKTIDLESISMTFVNHLEYRVGKYKDDVQPADVYQALALTVRDFLIDRWNETQEAVRRQRAKRVYYLSMEFLIGRLLECNLVNLGMRDVAAGTLRGLGFELDDLVAQEPDAGLGNGGLGRLAACFLDSVATLDLPVYGCGIRYEFGIFRQEIVDGWQREAPDSWLAHRNPWEIQRPDLTYRIPFGGHTQPLPDRPGASRWTPEDEVLAVAYDVFVPGFNTRTVNQLRLWNARASSEFDLQYFNDGDYLRALEEKARGETITKVLYPNDSVSQGRELRLRQQFLLVCASIQDALRTFLAEESDWERLPERVVFQMNDTHPALAVAELMRQLVDVHQLSWDHAWSLTTRTLAYTNHTVMPEALERWSVELLGRLLPRHLEIIYLINHHFLEGLRLAEAGEEEIRRLSLVEEGDPKRIRMAHLAIVGSKAVNGVSALHTELLRRHLFRDFAARWPGKLQNKTNGITPRRFLVAANPELTRVISQRIGREWILDLSRLRDLEEHAGDPELHADWERVRRANKERLAGIVAERCGVTLDPESIFDVQVKRIHEYKRQLLNVLRIIGEYRKIKQDPGREVPARAVLFGGKAAPGYHRAKLIIKLINSVAEVVNRDPDVGGRLRVAFLPDYNVSLAERIIAATDVSEQISTAGTEASGTGNMKFMLNGALTVGTLDGANVEILEEVGSEDIYIFGRTVEEIEALQRKGYDPLALIARDEEIREVLDLLRSDTFTGGHRGLFEELYQCLTHWGDHYFLLSDYPDYLRAQERIGRDFGDRGSWVTRSIRNTARAGRFSSDRTIGEYAAEIWNAEPVRQRPPRIQAL